MTGKALEGNARWPAEVLWAVVAWDQHAGPSGADSPGGKTIRVRVT